MGLVLESGMAVAWVTLTMNIVSLVIVNVYWVGFGYTFLINSLFFTYLLNSLFIYIPCFRRVQVAYRNK